MKTVIDFLILGIVVVIAGPVLTGYDRLCDALEPRRRVRTLAAPGRRAAR